MCNSLARQKRTARGKRQVSET